MNRTTTPRIALLVSLLSAVTARTSLAQPTAPPAALPPTAQPPAAPPPAALPPTAQPPAAPPPTTPPPTAPPAPAPSFPPPPGPAPTAPPPLAWSPSGPASAAPPGAVVMPPDYLLQPGRYPRKQPYDEGVRTPLGYHESREPRRGLFIAGISTLAAIYGGCALVGGGILAEDEGEGAWLLVPIGGPIAYAADVSDSNDRGAIIGLSLLSMGQAAGLALTIAGLAARRPVWIRNDVVAVDDTRRPSDAIVPTFRVGAGWASVGVEF